MLTFLNAVQLGILNKSYFLIQSYSDRIWVYDLKTFYIKT